MTPETSFEQTWISLPQGRYMPNIKAFPLSLVEIGQVVPEKMLFKGKVNRRTDAGQIAMAIARLRSLAQVS